MSDATVDDEQIATKKGSKLPMIIGLVLAVGGGGAGFFAVQSGLVGQSQAPASMSSEAPAPVEMAPLGDVAFIEVPPITISLGPQAQANHLRIRASLEVPARHVSDVEQILPRVQDVMNSYLRALDESDIEAQGALVRLRGQMLRRVKLVAGEGRVRDLLILEFVLN